MKKVKNRKIIIYSVLGCLLFLIFSLYGNIEQLYTNGLKSAKYSPYFQYQVNYEYRDNRGNKTKMSAVIPSANSNLPEKYTLDVEDRAIRMVIDDLKRNNLEIPDNILEQISIIRLN